MNVGLNIIIVIFLLGLLVALPFVLNLYFTKVSVEKQKLTTKQLMYVVNLTALATVVGAIEIPLGTIIPGGRFDFSEVIILIALIVLGYKKALLVVFLRSFIRFVIIPNDLEFIMKLLGEGIAILASFIIITSYTIMCMLLNKKNKPLMYEVEIEPRKVTFVEYILHPIFTTILLVLGLFTFHYFITVPIYNNLFGMNVNGFRDKFLVIMPFNILNIIKGILSPIIFLLARNQIQKVIK